MKNYKTKIVKKRKEKKGIILNIRNTKNKIDR